MDSDSNMDAPQISTIREETSPPPPLKRRTEAHPPPSSRSLKSGSGQWEIKPSDADEKQRRGDEDVYSDEQNEEGDVDMDAPQISTLQEEETPPPPKQNAKNKYRKIPRNGKEYRSYDPRSWEKPKELTAEDVSEEGEEEEDQLIDDDDDDLKPTPPAALSLPGRSSEGTSRRKSAKRKPRKRVTEEEKKKAVQPADIPNGPSKITWPDVPSWEPSGDNAVSSELTGLGNPPAEVISDVTAGKKKASPRKAPPVPRAKPKVNSK